MWSKEKIVSIKTAVEKVNAWKKAKETIVFTNGCFDIVHLGHVDYLEKAAHEGTKLVVGLNSDTSISRIKGSNRPIVEQESRARVLAALGFVDLVVFFDEDTPLHLIESLVPDVLIKGSDYLAENIVGANVVIQAGGRVKTIDLIQGYSTTKIIDKIKSLS